MLVCSLLNGQYWKNHHPERFEYGVNLLFSLINCSQHMPGSGTSLQQRGLGGNMRPKLACDSDNFIHNLHARIDLPVTSVYCF